MKEKYVISHKLRDEYEPLLMELDKEEMFYTTMEKEFNGEMATFVTWVDVFDADKFDTYEDAKMILDELPLRHTIMKIGEIEQ